MDSYLQIMLYVALERIKLLEMCWCCTHSDQWTVFHHLQTSALQKQRTADVDLADVGMVFRSQKVSHSPSDNQPLLCSRSQGIYLPGAPGFLISDDPRMLILKKSSLVMALKGGWLDSIVGHGHKQELLWSKTLCVLKSPARILSRFLNLNEKINKSPKDSKTLKIISIFWWQK